MENLFIGCHGVYPLVSQSGVISLLELYRRVLRRKWVRAMRELAFGQRGNRPGQRGNGTNGGNFDFPGLTPPILKGFASPFDQSFDVRWYIFSIRVSPSSFMFFQNHFWWILTFPGQAKIGISWGEYCKNQSLALFATDCLWEFIFERFWLQIGNNFGLPLEPGRGFESRRHKVDFWKQVGVKWLPPPPP